MGCPIVRNRVRRGSLYLFAIVLGCSSPSDHDAGGDPSIFPPPAGEYYLVDSRPALTPDGTTLIYYHHGTQARSAGIYRMPMDGDSVGAVPELLLPLSGSILDLPWDLEVSPDGRTLVYWLQNLWLLDLETLERTQVTFDQNARTPDWHPTRPLLIYSRVFVVEGPDSGGIRTVDLETGENAAVRDRDGSVLYGTAPRWHPDGRSVLFSNWDPTRTRVEIYRVFPDSTESIRLTQSERWWRNENAMWFADGREIVFRRQIDSMKSLRIMDADGDGIQSFPSRDRPLGDLGPFYDFSSDGIVVVTTQPDTCLAQYGILWLVRLDEGAAFAKRQLTRAPLDTVICTEE